MSPIRQFALFSAIVAAGLAAASYGSQPSAQGWTQSPRNDGSEQAAPPSDPYAQPQTSPYGRPADPYGANNGYPPASRQQPVDSYRPNTVYRPADASRPSDPYPPAGRARADDAYRPPADPPPSGYVDNYRSGRGYVSNQPPRDDAGPGYGTPYAPPPGAGEPDDRYGQPGGPPPPPYRDQPGPGYAQEQGTYSQGEILNAGHAFFGSVSKGLASVIEYAFQQSGRPNGYILGEDAGGAFVAGLRYGEGTLYTKDAGTHRVYWQGPSLGYDFGAEGSKTMVLVYNLRDPSEIYNRFGGVQGSAYIVGGVGIQFQKNDDVTLAPIRAGIGLRLGANVGYLKYTRAPTWNPF